MTVGGRAFSVAGPRVWNSLPDHVTSAEILIALHSVTDLRHFCYNSLIPSSGPSSGIPLRPL